MFCFFFFFFQAEDGIRDLYVTGVQTCALPISDWRWNRRKQFGHVGIHPFHLHWFLNDLEPRLCHGVRHGFDISSRLHPQRRRPDTESAADSGVRQSDHPLLQLLWWRYLADDTQVHVNVWLGMDAGNASLGSNRQAGYVGGA